MEEFIGEGQFGWGRFNIPDRALRPAGNWFSIGPVPGGEWDVHSGNAHHVVLVSPTFIGQLGTPVSVLVDRRDFDSLAETGLPPNLFFPQQPVDRVSKLH